MPKIATVTVGLLNLRSKPGSAEHDIIGDVKKGDRLQVLEQKKEPQDDWLKVKRLDGAIGWIAEYDRVYGKRYAVVEDVQLPTPKPLPLPPITDLSFAPPDWLHRAKEIAIPFAIVVVILAALCWLFW